MNTESQPITLAQLQETLKKTIDLQKRMIKASKARSSLPPGSSRAKVTTADANHANACEAYDRQQESLRKVMQQALDVGLDYHR